MDCKTLSTDGRTCIRSHALMNNTNLKLQFNTEDVIMEVQILSRETIKPSIPTPHSLHNFHLSSLDIIAPQMYMPLTFFYPVDDIYRLKTTEKLLQLKNSLSETLTHFYPLAGRIKKDDLVECNDEGVDFFEARVNGHLREVLQHPNGEVLSKLLPGDYYSARSGNDMLLSIQVNFFDCGGMAIGVNISHTMADGASLTTLVNAWASTARGSSEIVVTGFPLTSLFPLQDLSSLFRLKPIKTTVATRSFIFDGSKIEMLRSRDPKVASGGYLTRVEAVSALLWQCAMRARADATATRPSVATHAVNLRGRMVPPLPDYSFGNIFTVAVAKSEGCEESQHCLEVRIREAISKINGDYIKKLQGSDEVEWAKWNRDLEAYFSSDVDFYGFSSWLRFPIYDADFGWGKPVWVSSGGIPKTIFLFMETKGSEGIEVWANMAEEEMAKFEQDEELLAFAFPHAI